MTTEIFSKTPTARIYISELMFRLTYNLYKQIKTIQTKNNLKFLWFKNGKNFVRMLDNTPARVIQSQDDIWRLSDELGNRNVTIQQRKLKVL